MPEVNDLINSIVEKNPVDFESIFSDIMQERAEMAIEAHREVIANKIYNGVEESVEDDEDFDDDIEIDEDDLEDFDFDDLGEIDEEFE